MKKTLLLITFFPLFLFGIVKNDVTYKKEDKTTIKADSKVDNLENLKSELSQIKIDCENKEKSNEQTINSISTQLDAASYNLNVFGILFGIAAIILGIYITYIERKVIKIREENKDLLDKAKDVKAEVIAINNLIQNDIHGLFRKIKREETVDILDRLTGTPEDITNLSRILLTRKLEKNDFKILKEAYSKLEEDEKKGSNGFTFEMSYEDQYKLLFFQHFLDLSMFDDKIRVDLIEFIPKGINCAFKNDIIKSTNDFVSAINDLGYQLMTKEINSFMKGISECKFKNSSFVYEIFTNGIKNRTDQFRFFNIISDEKELRIGKSNYGNMLIKLYSSTELNQAEKEVVEKTNQIILELEKEEEEERKRIEKEKEIAEERKRKLEEKNIPKDAK